MKPLNEKSETGLMARVTKLADRLAVLENDTDMLESVLSPVLAPVPENPKGTGAAEPVAGSCASANIEHACDRVAVLQCRLKDLLVRLESDL